MVWGIGPSPLALHSDAAMLPTAPAARPWLLVRRAIFTVTVAGAVAVVPSGARAEFPRFFRGLTSPFRAAHRHAPPLPADPCLDRLADEVAWLEHHVNHYGSIVAKAPDVWGQNRLTQHRAEYEKQMQKQLGLFEPRASASLRRSDQAFLGMALALQSASGRRRGNDEVALPAASSSSNALTTISGLIP